MVFKWICDCGEEREKEIKKEWASERAKEGGEAGR